MAEKMSETRIQERLSQVLDRDYWLRLNPHLHIDSEGFHSRLPSYEPLPGLIDQLYNEGYFVAESLFDPSLVKVLADSVRKLVAEGWSPVFIFVYDEVWDLVRSDTVRSLLGSALGNGYLQAIDFWAWHIGLNGKSSGYRPHREIAKQQFMPNGKPKSLTFWIPFTDATIDNGCMYVIPQDLEMQGNDPNFPEIFERIYNGNYNTFLLHRARALPAPAGSLLCWNHFVLHWGSMVSARAKGNRISIGMEFVRGDIDFDAWEKLAYPEHLCSKGHFDSSLRPTFAKRLAAIPRQVAGYDYEMTPELRAIAQKLDETLR